MIFDKNLYTVRNSIFNFLSLEFGDEPRTLTAAGIGTATQGATWPGICVGPCQNGIRQNTLVSLMTMHPQRHVPWVVPERRVRRRRSPRRRRGARDEVPWPHWHAGRLHPRGWVAPHVQRSSEVLHRMRRRWQRRRREADGWHSPCVGIIGSFRGGRGSPGSVHLPSLGPARCLRLPC